jgi:hypothetical protein
MVERRTTSTDRLYSESRQFPRGRVRDEGPQRPVPHSPSLESKGPALRNNRPQDPEDQHGPGYDGDAKGWLRGAVGTPTGHDETAENKPSFDHSPPRDKMRR